MNYGLLQYSDVVEPIIRFDDKEGQREITEFMKVLSNIKYHSGFSTLTGTAMKYAAEKEFSAERGARENVRKVFSDL